MFGIAARMVELHPDLEAGCKCSRNIVVPERDGTLAVQGVAVAVTLYTLLPEDQPDKLTAAIRSFLAEPPVKQ